MLDIISIIAEQKINMQTFGMRYNLLKKCNLFLEYSYEL